MGGDGFVMLKNSKYLIDAIAGIDTLRLLLKFFHIDDNDFIDPLKMKKSNSSSSSESSPFKSNQK
jgi:hypothetical protein